jgi:hypothetical protein
MKLLIGVALMVLLFIAPSPVSQITFYLLLSYVIFRAAPGIISDINRLPSLRRVGAKRAPRGKYETGGL